MKLAPAKRERTEGRRMAFPRSGRGTPVHSAAGRAGAEGGGPVRLPYHRSTGARRLHSAIPERGKGRKSACCMHREKFYAFNACMVHATREENRQKFHAF